MERIGRFTVTFRVKEYIDCNLTKREEKVRGDNNHRVGGRRQMRRYPSEHDATPGQGVSTPGHRKSKTSHRRQQGGTKVGKETKELNIPERKNRSRELKSQMNRQLPKPLGKKKMPVRESGDRKNLAQSF